jgi:hypothetical protein
MQNGIAKKDILLSHLDDKKHISYEYASFSLQGYLW